MAIFTSRLAPVVISVFPVRDCPKMVRVHAPAVTAFVINLQTVWNITVEYLKRYSMRLHASCSEPEFTVAFFGQARRPFPAFGISVKFKLFYESIKDWSICGHNSSLGWSNNREHVIGHDFIHSFLLLRPVGGKPDDHLAEHFIERDDVASTELGNEPVYKRVIKPNMFNRFWNPIHSSVVVFFVHKQKPTHAPKVKSANERPQSGRELENQLFSFFSRLLQSRAQTLPMSV